MQRYIIKRGVDLRMRQEEKLDYISGSSGCAFLVNNAHTLVHIVIASDPEVTIRVKIPGWLKGTFEGYFNRWILKRFDWILGTQVSVPKTPKAKVIDFHTERKYRNAQKRMK